MLYTSFYVFTFPEFIIQMCQVHYAPVMYMYIVSTYEQQDNLRIAIDTVHSNII